MTRNNYYVIWHNFNDFFVKLDVKPDEWEDRLTLYVTYLIDQGRISTTIRCYISAIRAILREVVVELTEDKVLLASLMRACEWRDTVSNRLPIRKGLLKFIIKALQDMFASQPYLKILYIALFLTTYFGLFRIGEVTESLHVVLAQNIHVGTNKNKLLFVLHISKTHNKGSKPQTIKISSETSSNKFCCPFWAVKQFVLIRKKFINNKQFFIFRDRSPVTPAHFRAVLAKAIKWNKLNPLSYSSQGFRAGRSSDLLDLGLSVETIQKLGRWKSSAVYTYLRP